MPLSQQARIALTAIQTGTMVIQVHSTSEAGEYRAGLAPAGGALQQPVHRRIVDMLRRHAYISLSNAWSHGDGQVAEYRITEGGNWAPSDKLDCRPWAP